MPRTLWHRASGRYVVNLNTAKKYTPEGHARTENRILIGQDIGARAFELIYGAVKPGGEAKSHSHDVESGFYFLRGKALVEIGSRKFRVRAGSAVFIPRGARHRVKCVGKTSFRVLVVYAPPRKSSSR